MMRFVAMLITIGLLVAVCVAEAATINVRRDGTGDFTTIQPALDAAAAGDTIAIGPGEYTEFQTIRPPLWNWSIDIYGYITVDNLTLIGAGADETKIGPSTPQYDSIHFTPKCIWAWAMSRLTVRDLTVRNCYDGIYGPDGLLSVYDSRSESNRTGIFVLSRQLWVEHCWFSGIGPAPNGVTHTSNCTTSIVRNCGFEDCELDYDGVEDFVAESCGFDGGPGGIGVYNASVGRIANITLSCELFGINVNSSTCQVRDVRVNGGEIGIVVENGYLSASDVQIDSTSEAAFYLINPRAFEVHESDILPDSGYAVQFYSQAIPPSRIFDCTGNYWGLADSTAISQLIWDGNDSHGIDDFIDFVPFAGGSTPTERESWGAVKALFR
jgi:hypothetical protein